MTTRSRLIARRIEFLTRIKPRLIRLRASQKELGYITFYESQRGIIQMNRIPISKTRAFDMVAYIMIQRNLSRTFILKSEEQVKESILLRQLTTAPIGYYRRHRNKFIVNKIKNRLDSFEIIRKPLKVKKVKKKVKK